MATVHAFLVAIDQYPNPNIRLKGCINDLELVKGFLEANCSARELEIRILCLTDAAATRENIIKGFSHFESASEEDFCFFFFAGHGSRNPAPKEFWHLEPDHEHESLVCFDSRETLGRDLVDKELSFLIWKATKDKKVHFLVATDCCHSGSITRLGKDVKHRQINGKLNSVPVSEYLGVEFYKKDNLGQYTPPRGRYIHLGACHKSQTAKEITANGDRHGIFTYALIEMLQIFQGNISYAELITRTRISIKNRVNDQSPQIDAVEPLDKNLFFLSKTPKKDDRSFLVSHDKSLGWIVHAGTLQGFVQDAVANPTVLKLVGSDREISTSQVFLDRSTVTGLEHINPNETFYAKILRIATNKYTLAFSPECEEEGKMFLTKILDEKRNNLFDWSSDSLKAYYILHAIGGTFYLTTRYSNRPLFEVVQGYNKQNAILFLNRISEVINWVQLLENCNPESQIYDDELDIQLSRVIDPGNETDNAQVVLEDWRAQSNYPYLFDGNEWQRPSFRCRIKNIGKRNLYISMLFLGDDYSITNKLLPNVILSPGQEAHVNHMGFLTIPIEIDDSYQNWGLTQVSNYLKFIVCTEHFDTDKLNQLGLKFENSNLFSSLETRTIGQRSYYGLNWITKEIEIRIQRPFTPINLGENKILLFGNFLEFPRSIQGEIALNTIENISQYFQKPLEGFFNEDQNYLPIELGPVESSPGLFVIEIMIAENIDDVLVSTPMQIEFKELNMDPTRVMVFGLNPKNCQIQTIKFTMSSNIVSIYQLPDKSPSVYGSSRKLILGYK